MLLVVTRSPVLPINFPLRRSWHLDRNMAHRTMARSPMPMPGTCWNSDDISGRNNTLPRLSCNDSLALNDLQHLITLVNMWYCACPCTEIHGKHLNLATLLSVDEALGSHF